MEIYVRRHNFLSVYPNRRNACGPADFLQAEFFLPPGGIKFFRQVISTVKRELFPVKNISVVY